MKTQPALRNPRSATRVLGLFATFVLMACAATSARAGSYAVSYSGGNVNASGRTSPYTSSQDSPVSYGGGGSFGWGTSTTSDGTVVPWSGDLHCDGAITATFTWSGGADDPPPTSVVIMEQSSVIAGGVAMSNGLPSTFTLDSGVDFNPVTGSPTPASGASYVNLNSSSGGTRYKIKEAPGLSFSITCSPSLEVVGIDMSVAGPPSNGGGSGRGGISYQATATPLEIVLSGGIGARDQKKFLIGQQVTATIATGGLTATNANYYWAVSGGEAFKSWTPTDKPNTSTTFVGLSGQTASTLTFCFRKVASSGTKETVACPVHLAVPTGALPTAGLDAQLSRDCTVDVPIVTFTAFTGTVQSIISDHFPDKTNPKGMQFLDCLDPLLTAKGQSEGISWNGTVKAPTGYGSGGGWNYTQLVTPGRSTTTAGVALPFSLNGTLVLDNTFGYDPVFTDTPSLFPDDGTLEESYDSPSYYFGQPFGTASHVEVFDNFQTYILYKPPGTGSQFVPLKNSTWYWKGQGDQGTSGGIWILSKQDAKWTLGSDFPVHPMWSHNVTEGTPK